MKKISLTFLSVIVMSLVSVCQNVGIGTSTPTEKLQVAGNIKTDTIKPNAIRFTPGADEGKVLTSDANGNASWQKINTGGADAGYGSWGDCSMNDLSEYLPIADSVGESGDRLGYRVAMSGNFAVVGKPYGNVNGNNNQGMVYLYQFNGSTWVLLQKLFDANGQANDYFGFSVAISADHIAIGAVGADINGVSLGAVYIYRYIGGSWLFAQKVTDPAGAAGDNFGDAVSITDSHLAVGAPNDEVSGHQYSGSVVMFRRSVNTWNFLQKLTDANGSGYLRKFGSSVSLFNDQVVIGSPYNSVVNEYKEGTADVFKFNGSSWLHLGRLTGPTGSNALTAGFGTSVSMYGEYLAIGVPADRPLATGEHIGSVYFFRYNGTNWTFHSRVFNDQAEDYTNFGYSVSMSASYVLIGTFDETFNGHTESGAARIYKRIGPGWSRVQLVTDKTADRIEHFGTTVSIDGNTRRFIIGAPGYMNSAGKAVFGKIY